MLSRISRSSFLTAPKLNSMPMLVMHVGRMRMRVHQNRMPMLMHVRLAWRILWPMGMLMMLIMRVSMRMSYRFMRVDMLVAL